MDQSAFGRLFAALFGSHAGDVRAMLLGLAIVFAISLLVAALIAAIHLTWQLGPRLVARRRGVPFDSLVQERIDRSERAAMPWLVTAGLLLAWEIGVRAGGVAEIVLPAPSRIFEVAVQRADVLLRFSLDTFVTTLIGFAMAIVGGLLLGLAVGASALVYSGLYPLLIAFNAIPKVAIVPILMIWLGVGSAPAVITAFVISFFPIVVNVATGLATMEPEMRDVLRSLGASRREVLLKAGIPRALPYLFASLKVAITLAFIGSVIAETVGGNRGIGFLMLSAGARNDAPTTFAGLFAIAVMGVAMYAACAYVERRMTRWAFRGELVN